MKGSVMAGRSRGSDVRGGGARERRSGAGARKPGSCGGKRRASGEERSRDCLSNLYDRRGRKDAELVPLSDRGCGTNGRGMDTGRATTPVHARGDRRAERSPGSLLAAATRSGVFGRTEIDFSTDYRYLVRVTETTVHQFDPLAFRLAWCPHRSRGR